MPDQRMSLDAVVFVLFCFLPQANLAVQEGRHRVAASELEKAESQLAEKEAEFQVVQAKCDAAVKEKQVWSYRYKMLPC